MVTYEKGVLGKLALRPSSDVACPLVSLPAPLIYPRAVPFHRRFMPHTPPPPRSLFIRPGRAAGISHSRLPSLGRGG